MNQALMLVTYQLIKIVKELNHQKHIFVLYDIFLITAS